MSDLAFPKPTKRERARKPLSRSTVHIKVYRPAGTVRREAKAAGNLTNDQWEQIVEFYRDPARSDVIRCAYCLTNTALVCEHVIPVSKGGEYTASNVVPACVPCNQRKGTQTWEPKLRHPFMEEAA